MLKTYSHLLTFKSFKERFEYLSIGGTVGESTFGSKRYLNQILYTSDAWRKLRNDIILRDSGCDLGVNGFDIGGQIYIHHINPITIDDIKCRRPCVMDPDNLICTSKLTHEAIHYGDYGLVENYIFSERTPGDTRLW